VRQFNPNTCTPEWRLRPLRAPVCLLLFAGFFASGIAAWSLWTKASELDQARFDAEASAIRQQLDSITERHALELNRFADFHSLQGELTQTSWQEFVNRLAPAANLPAIEEIAYLTNGAIKSVAYLESARGTNEGGLFTMAKHSVLGVPEDFNICFHWTNGAAIPPDETLGWLRGDAVYRHTFRPVMNGRMISSPRRIVAGSGDKSHPSVVLLFPVFTPDLGARLKGFAPEYHAHIREASLLGVVAASINWPLLLTLNFPHLSQVAVEVFSSANLNISSWMGPFGRLPISLSPDFSDSLRRIEEWPFFRSRWTLAFFPTPRFFHHSTRYWGWVALLGGMFFSLLVSGILAIEVRAREKHERIAAQLRLALDDLRLARKNYERLTQDLHDGTIQSLYALQLGISRAGDQARPLSAELAERLADYRRNVSSVVGELRGFIMNHQASQKTEGDLSTVLTAILHRLQASTDILLTPEISLEAARLLSERQAVQFANIAHEALSNALRHAQPEKVVVVLRCGMEGVALEIIDDGVGFELARPLNPGMGLATMSARAHDLGATWEVHSAPGAGTRVKVLLPLPTQSNELKK